MIHAYSSTRHLPYQAWCSCVYIVLFLLPCNMSVMGSLVTRYASSLAMFRSIESRFCLLDPKNFFFPHLPSNRVHTILALHVISHHGFYSLTRLTYFLGHFQFLEGRAWMITINSALPHVMHDPTLLMQFPHVLHQRHMHTRCSIFHSHLHSLKSSIIITQYVSDHVDPVIMSTAMMMIHHHPFYHTPQIL